MNHIEIYNTTTLLLNDLQEMILLFRMQNFNRGERIFASWSVRYGQIISELAGKKSILNEAACQNAAAPAEASGRAEGEPGIQGAVLIDENVILSELQALMQAMEQKDYVLMADLMQMQTVVFLESVQNALRELIVAEAGSGSADNELLDDDHRTDMLLRAAGSSCEADGKTYRLEPTTSGNLTLSVTDAQGMYYLHSNAYPAYEGELFAQQYYDADVPAYAVYGLGLGYHVLALCKASHGLVPVTVFESDANVIELARSVVDFGAYEGRNLKIVHDPVLAAFAEAVSGNTTAVIHYPSIRGVEDPGIRNRLMQIFVQDSSIRNQIGDMLTNFRYNTEHAAGLADDLADDFNGRDVILVAAGPSLDKNVELLRPLIGAQGSDDQKEFSKPDGQMKNRPTVVCVGTAFRKLMNAGLRPDYVAFLDSSVRIRAQINGLENETVPALLASTATMTIASDYRGKKYLLCQQGFEPAERYAKERGGRIYETGGSVITIILDLAVQLGAKRIITIGLDLAYSGMQL
ncbi:MAG: DUF115 domain-containing protein, partial [Lachnospiraceae bacterium]|nr:DUF115 domain-containing protein [Lachnospiraceae bacterium]